MAARRKGELLAGLAEQHSALEERYHSFHELGGVGGRRWERDCFRLYNSTLCRGLFSLYEELGHSSVHGQWWEPCRSDASKLFVRSMLTYFLYAQVSSSTQRRPSLELDLCARFPPTLPSRTLPRLTQCFEQEIDAARGESAIVTDFQDELQAAWRPSRWSFHSADCCCGSPKARCQELVVGSRCAPCPPVVVVPTTWDDSRGALGWPRQGGDDEHSSSSWSMWELQRRRCSAQATALDPFPQVTGFGMWAQHTCVNVCAASKRNKFETSRWHARATDTQERSLRQVSI